jgi:hypothetical protein
MRNIHALFHEKVPEKAHGYCFTTLLMPTNSSLHAAGWFIYVFHALNLNTILAR